MSEQLSGNGTWPPPQVVRTDCLALIRELGPEAAYERVRELVREGRVVLSDGRRRPTDERDLEMFRLRVVDKMTLRAIGACFGVTGGRVRQLLHWHFGLTHQGLRSLRWEAVGGDGQSLSHPYRQSIGTAQPPPQQRSIIADPATVEAVRETLTTLLADE